MDIKSLTDNLSVSGQIALAELVAIKEQGFRSIICNRPDGEGSDQPTFEEISAVAKAQGLEVIYQPVTMVTDADAEAFSKSLTALPSPTLAYCRSGTRCSTLWALGQAANGTMATDKILATTSAAGYDLSGMADRLATNVKPAAEAPKAEPAAQTSKTQAAAQAPTQEKSMTKSHEVVIVGAGAAGISLAASLKSRQADLEVVVIDPADTHYYQPGWTMVGGGIFEAKQTAHSMTSVIPKGVEWIKASVETFNPADNAVVLSDGQVVTYKRLIVCPGLKLDWDKVEGLAETIGKHGVTSNYRYDLAPYTWELVQAMKSGRAIFTQPPMPIKCAGAPQKAMYLSGDAWSRSGVLKDIDIQFNNAGGVLFGVADYVPALMEYVKKYDASLNFFHNLVAVDGAAKKAWFDVAKPDTPVERIEMEFDMMHVCPPQTAPDFIRNSPLVDAAGWVDVDQATLRHKTYENIWSLGDVMNAPNAKTAAAARVQAPIVAENVLADIRSSSPVAQYNGYGSCPLTVERGKIVLAEFGYGGALLPSFPKFLLDGTKPTRLAWILKEKILPPLYWNAMLKGREWLVKPETKADS